MRSECVRAHVRTRVVALQLSATFFLLITMGDDLRAERRRRVAAAAAARASATPPRTLRHPRREDTTTHGRLLTQQPTDTDTHHPVTVRRADADGFAAAGSCFADDSVPGGSPSRRRVQRSMPLWGTDANCMEGMTPIRPM